MGISKFLIAGVLLWPLLGLAEVVTEALPEMKVGTIGTDTGVSAAVWGEKPDAAEILAQIKAAGEAPLNDVEKEILKRVLLADMGGVAALEELGEEYLRVRVKALVAQSMADEAIALIDRVPAKNLSNTLKQLKAETLLIMGRAEEACAEGYPESFEAEEAFIRAVCADMIGVPPASALAYEVYRESGRDNHPFLNAAGEVLYRDMKVAMPAGGPSIWEMPVAARVWGKEVLNKPLSAAHLRVLTGQERVPSDVREAAQSRISKKPAVSVNGSILLHLTQMASERQQVEALLKGKNAK